MANKRTTAITYPRLLVGASLIGLVASFWQLTERIHMLKYPADPLNCNINPVVDCGSVLGDKLAAVFGPPNALIGVVIFSLLFALSLQRVSGGSWTRFVQKFVLTLSTIIFLFSIWFFSVSLYSIGKICIFCVFIWAVSMPIAVYGVKDYLENQKKLSASAEKTKRFLQKNHLTILATIYAILITLFLLRFQEYYFG